MKWTALTVMVLIAVLAVHIYLVRKPGIDTRTRIMARIDIHQPLTRGQADSITNWLYRQQGVDHVLCNASTSIVVFTYSPLKANSDAITGRFITTLHYPHATRYVPTKKELRGGCPAGF